MHGVRIARQARKLHFLQPWIASPAALGLSSSIGSALRVFGRSVVREFIFLCEFILAPNV
jgi:hypothetical protein